MQALLLIRSLAHPGGTRRPRWPGAPRRLLSIAALLSLAFLLCVPPGCRPPRPAPMPVPASPDSLRAWLGEGACPGALSGKATVRVVVGGRRVPALNAQFVVFREAGLRLLLRPGVLAPVLTLWVGEREWDLRIPRQQVAFAYDSTALARAVPRRAAGAPEDAGSLVRSDVPAPAELTRVGWWLVSPASLVTSLREPILTQQGGRWILRGRLTRDSGAARSAEVWIDSGNRAIALWSLEDASGQTLARVAYDPPFASGSTEARLNFLLPGLDVQGAVALEKLTPHADPPGPRPALPSGWELIPYQELPSFLRDLAEGPDSGS